MKFNRIAVLGTLFVGLAFSSLTGMAQQRPQGGQGGPGGGRGNFDPAQFQQRMMDRIKEQLAASDTEWKVMEPMVSSVMEKQRATRGGGFPFGRTGGRGGRPGGDNNGPQGRGPGGDVDSATEALQAAIESKTTSAADIQAKLKAVRDSRAKKEAELAKAQAQLKQICTARQEAQLVLMGFLQ